MKILGISGSLRRHSYNTYLLLAAGELVESASFELFDHADVPLYNEDIDGEDRPASVDGLLAAIASTDALLLATPEYNHSISGVLKNIIDWASRPAFDSVLKDKPCGVVSCSMSPIGGARAQQHLKAILASTLTPVYPAIEYVLPMAQQAFDDQGVLIDATAATPAGALCQWFDRVGDTRSRVYPKVS